jgi:HD-GYP domain-containing protein (c-di-GMP phosphodiesterase class II)
MKEENKTEAELIKEVNTLRKEQEESALNDFTERKQVEEKEHHKNIQLLSKTAMQFVEFPVDKNLYNFIGEQLKELIGKDSYIVINTFDGETSISTIRAVLGLGKFTDKFIKLLGRDPVGMTFYVEDTDQHCTDGKIHLYEEGLYGLLLKTVPKTLCKSMEKLLNIKKLYTIDLAKQEQFFGSIIIFLKEGAGELKNKQIIEAFIKQASIALQRKQAEEALHKSETRYKNLYSMMRLMCDNLPDLIWTKDMEGKFLFVNKACSEILLDARDTDEPIGKTDIYFADRMMKSHPEIHNYISFGKKCVESDLTVIKTKKPMRFDESGNMKGKFLSFDVYKAPFNDENGNIIGTVGSAKIVTKEKQMEKELLESYQRLKKTMDATIDTMSNIIEAKDPYTSGHQHRVCQLAVPLAQELGLSEDKIEGIRIASLIHDIGKIGLPTEILSKPTRLTDIEFGLIKGHSQTGYNILKSIDFPWPIAEIVLQHHERLDGSGYPRGLKGDGILLEAKIICVADVVEAMSSHRPYRAALGIDVALEEIFKNRGILYDPEIVDVCIKLFKEKSFKFE